MLCIATTYHTLLVINELRHRLGQHKHNEDVISPNGMVKYTFTLEVHGSSGIVRFPPAIRWGMGFSFQYLV